MTETIKQRIFVPGRPARSDVLIATVILVVGQLSTWTGSSDHLALTVPIAFLAAASLAWRREAPLVSLVVLFSAILLQGLLGEPPTSIWFLATLLFAIFSATTNVPRGQIAWVAVLSLGTVEVVTLLDPTSTRSDKLFTALVLAGAPLLSGLALRRQSGQSRELSTLNQHLRVEHEERARKAVAAERARIARDLHDVIAHSVSVMIVQAGAAEQVLATDPANARESLHAIRTTGKAALLDMRRLLGVLRTESDDLELAPQPTLQDIDELSRQFATAGLAVEVSRSGDLRSLASGVEMTAYRICQEALTNSLKHGGSSALLALRYAPSSLEIEVLDSGCDQSTNETPNGGNGLIGMRERVAIYGGELSAGPLPDGTFAVNARLPLELAGK